MTSLPVGLGAEHEGERCSRR